MKPAVEELWLQRLYKMTGEQQDFLIKLHNKVFDCEGEGMPRKYWCKSCETTFTRLSELFARFEFQNTQHRQISRRSTSMHPGFFGYN